MPINFPGLYLSLPSEHLYSLYTDIKSPGIYATQLPNGSYLGITAIEGKPITANVNFSVCDLIIIDSIFN
ncbi:hypothetical protein [Sphingobacterium sp. JUb56]|uniref:hypothetical protein n=1 Tax=Sphingobacterium sp. JUb56 TaxID=2587145 RepID=UPI00161BE903|nr:hypothetical protein [Sphingobacterium sp. JUb56]MBB2953467.1 hypothetical protein [Sphingobacterium sp. JUb56]